MSGQGYHFAISREQAEALLSCKDPAAILDFTDALQEDFREGAGGCGGYKEWDVLHRLLSDGTFNPRGDTPPLNRCFFGGHLLVTEGAIVNLVLPEEVRETAAALVNRDGAWFRQRFLDLFAPEHPGPIPEQDVEWYSELFEELKGFYRRSAEGDRAVVFVTDDCLSYFYKPGAEAEGHEPG
jgi:hypothetical protein